MSRVGRLLPWLIGIAVMAGDAGPLRGQANLDAGKSPAQIFSNTCAACHRSPRELKQTSVGFLREHYSTGGREAAAMAGYLAAIGSDPRAVQQRRPPALGAGQASPSGEAAVRPSDAAKAAEGAAGKVAPPLGQRRDRQSDGRGSGRRARRRSLANRRGPRAAAEAGRGIRGIGKRIQPLLFSDPASGASVPSSRARRASSASARKTLLPQAQLARRPLRPRRGQW